MRMDMKILKYLLITGLVLSVTDGQTIKKDGKEVASFTQAEALEMLKARDAQWKGKLAKADSLIASKNVVINECESLVAEIEKNANVEFVLSEAKSRQIKILKTRDEANEEMIKALQPKWYENQYLWLVIGVVLGKI
tara:strand:- start:2265 stop:2675 length:411 start_codon:yes stop_codon:yes gene_type:complete